METTTGKRWAPLESKKAPWPHRPAERVQSEVTPLVEQLALRETREKLVRTTFLAERNAVRLQQIEDAKVLQPVPNLQAPVGLSDKPFTSLCPVAKTAMKSLEELRAELLGQIKAKPSSCI